MYVNNSHFLLYEEILLHGLIEHDLVFSSAYYYTQPCHDTCEAARLHTIEIECVNLECSFRENFIKANKTIISCGLFTS